MISIITVCYNNLDGLIQTVNSVAALKDFSSNRNFIQFVVIDGGSDDGTKEFLALVPSTVIDLFISEPDYGIYDAMNKGIDHSVGDYIIFLNSGDYLVGTFDVLKVVEPGFIPVCLGDISGNIIRKIRYKIRLRGLPNCHQGIFFPRTNIRYDIHYRISADYKFFLEHGSYSFNGRYGDGAYVFYNNEGLSSTNYIKRDKQMFEIRKIFFGYWLALLFEIEPFLKRFVKKFFWKYLQRSRV
jgi:glycosyltransferase involved in cell wall biosynthesis